MKFARSKDWWLSRCRDEPEVPIGAGNFCAVERPSFWATTWRLLGFRSAGWPDMRDLDARADLAESHLSSQTNIHFDWADRLRVLISGRVMVSTAIKTDVVVPLAISRSNVGVLPPNYPIRLL